MKSMQTEITTEFLSYIKSIFKGETGSLSNLPLPYKGYLTLYPKENYLQVVLRFNDHKLVSHGEFLNAILERQKQKFLPFEIAGHKVEIKDKSLKIGCKEVLFQNLQALKSAVAQWKETPLQKEIYTESSPELRAYLRSVKTKAECCLHPHSDSGFTYIRLNANGSLEGANHVYKAEHFSIGRFIDAVISYKPHELAMSGVVPNCVVKIDADGLLITERDNEAGYRVTFEEFDKLLVAIKA